MVGKGLTKGIKVQGETPNLSVNKNKVNQALKFVQDINHCEQYKLTFVKEKTSGVIESEKSTLGIKLPATVNLPTVFTLKDNLIELTKGELDKVLASKDGNILKEKLRNTLSAKKVAEFEATL